MIVEDDPALTKTLTRSFKRRGYEVAAVGTPDQLSTLLKQFRPDFAVVDLKLGSESGLPCIQALHRINPAMRIVVVTGYASVATAVEAIKLGALQYLTKPVGADVIERAFEQVDGNAAVQIADRPSSLKSWEWDRISETLAQTGFNISEAARRLDMHRRTLARKLKRHCSR